MERHATDFVKTLRKGTLGNHFSFRCKNRKGNLSKPFRNLVIVWDFLLL